MEEKGNKAQNMATRVCIALHTMQTGNQPETGLCKTLRVLSKLIFLAHYSQVFSLASALKKKAMKPKSWKQGLSQTTENYASRTSIYGISYTSLTGIWALRIDSFGQSLLFPSWPWPLSSLGTIGLSGRRTRSKLCPTAFSMSWGGKSVNGVHPLWKPSPTRHKTCCHIIQVYLNDVTALKPTGPKSPSGFHLINIWSPVGITKAIPKHCLLWDTC